MIETFNPLEIKLKILEMMPTSISYSSDYIYLIFKSRSKKNKYKQRIRVRIRLRFVSKQYPHINIGFLNRALKHILTKYNLQNNDPNYYYGSHGRNRTLFYKQRRTFKDYRKDRKVN